MLGKISLQYESSYKNISTAKFYFKWLSLLYPGLWYFYFCRHTYWGNGKNCHLSSFRTWWGEEGGEEKGIKVLSEAAKFLGASTNATSRLLPIPNVPSQSTLSNHPHFSTGLEDVIETFNLASYPETTCPL